VDELAGQLPHDLGMLEDDLGHERARLQVTAALALEQVALGADDGTLLEPLESLNMAVRMARWLSMARVDVLLHGEEPMTIDEATRRSWSMRGTPIPEGTCEQATYPQLIIGYDCATYGFVWDTILRDDLMSRFEQEGMTSPALGMAYRRAILEAPWTRDPLAGHAEFMGRPWSTDAFMEAIERGGA